MKGFIGLVKRNLLIFFKDRQSVFFSLLTSIIVLVLYLLFLKETFVNGINSVIASYPELGGLLPEGDLDTFANLFLLNGILGSAMITIPYNCLSTLVRDRENKVDYDILATPVRRGQIILAYFIAAALSSTLITSAILSAGLIILRALGQIYLDTAAILELFGVAAMGSVSATAFFMIIMLLFKSTAASGAFFGILSAAAGFVIGAYIPISQFSEGIRTICNIFPASQVTIILRNKLLNGVLAHMDSAIGGLDGGMFTAGLKDYFSFTAHMFGKELGLMQMVIYVTAGIAVCIALQVILYSKSYKKK